MARGGANHPSGAATTLNDVRQTAWDASLAAARVFRDDVIVLLIGALTDKCVTSKGPRRREAVQGRIVDGRPLNTRHNAVL